MTINEAKFNQVVSEAKAKAANQPEWLRAIEKAAKAILSGEMIVTTLAHGALVTTPGGTYRANGACDCPARTKHCYHRAGARLWHLYETEVATPATSRATLIADIKSAWTCKYPQDNLADELMRRFKRNQLEMLSTDFLQAIHAIL